MATARVIVVTAVAATCLSLLMSVYFTRNNKQEIRKKSKEISRAIPSANTGPNNHIPPTATKKHADTPKGKKGGWASVMLPFYSLGILAYVVYVVGKIMSKKYSSSGKGADIKVSWSRQKPPKGNSKTKITMHELLQLEQKLQETETAVQQIFAQTCVAVKAANRALDSATSSEEDFATRPAKFPPKKLKLDTESELSTFSSDGRQSKSFENKYGSPNVRKRKIKRPRRISRKEKRSSFNGNVSSSDSETDLSPRHRDFISHRNQPSEDGVDCSTLSPEKDTCSIKCQELENKPQECSNQAKQNDELLRTAKDIRNTVSVLQSYIEDKKAELNTK